MTIKTHLRCIGAAAALLALFLGGCTSQELATGETRKPVNFNNLYTLKIQSVETSPVPLGRNTLRIQVEYQSLTNQRVVPPMEEDFSLLWYSGISGIQETRYPRQEISKLARHYAGEAPAALGPQESAEMTLRFPLPEGEILGILYRSGLPLPLISEEDPRFEPLKTYVAQRRQEALAFMATADFSPGAFRNMMLGKGIPYQIINQNGLTLSQAAYLYGNRELWESLIEEGRADQNEITSLEQQLSRP